VLKNFDNLRQVNNDRVYKFDLSFVELFEWVCVVPSTHRYDRVSDLLSGRQTTHAAQRTAKSTLTYELGTGERFPSLFSLLPPYTDIETEEE